MSSKMSAIAFSVWLSPAAVGARARPRGCARCMLSASSARCVHGHPGGWKWQQSTPENPCNAQRPASVLCQQQSMHSIHVRKRAMQPAAVTMKPDSSQLRTRPQSPSVLYQCDTLIKTNRFIVSSSAFGRCRCCRAVACAVPRPCRALACELEMHKVVCLVLHLCSMHACMHTCVRVIPVHTATTTGTLPTAHTRVLLLAPRPREPAR